MKHVRIETNRLLVLICCVWFGVLVVSPVIIEIMALLGVGTDKWPFRHRLIMYTIGLPFAVWIFRAEWQKFIIRSLVVEERGLFWEGRVERLIPWSSVESIVEKVSLMDDRRIILRVTGGRRIVIHDGISNYKDVRNAIRQCFPGKCKLASDESEDK